MVDPTATGPQRPWRILILAVVALLVVMLAVALWSEEEDLESLPAEQVESGEGTAP